MSRTLHRSDCVPASTSLLFPAVHNVVHEVCESCQTTNRVSQRNNGIVVRFQDPVTEVRLSLRFLEKMFIFLPGLISSSTSSVTLRRFFADILLPNFPHCHIDYTSFSVSAPPLPRGISASRRSPSMSTVSQTLDEVSLFKFLVVFVSTPSPAPLGLRLRPE